MLVRLDAGDAVSNQALAIHRILQQRGIESRIFANGLDEFGARHARLDAEYAPFRSQPGDLLIYHYSIYCDNYREYLQTRNRRVLIYHNITPPEWFEPYDSGIAGLCRQGREVLPLLAGGDLALGDSDFNRRELVEMGFPEERTGVLPINPPLGRLLEGEEDPEVRRRLADGLTNLLYVGRVVPNKRVEDLIVLFNRYHRQVNARSRLVLAGRVFTPYALRLWRMVEELGLERRVLFFGKIDDRGLRTCYRRSHLYLSMSEHEGFCVPLLEAFSCGLPVFAYAAGAVPETMGDAGVLFDDKDFPLLAEMLEAVRSDPLLSGRIVEAQKRRLQDFSEESFLERFDGTVGAFIGSMGGGA
jgi:glycosyltransferase involved in cell wall biosynthesis